MAVRRLTAAVLERSGYRVIAADGADEAVRLASNGAVIHLVIMDVMIPGSAGAEVARRLAGSGLQAQVLFISGYEAASLTRQGRLAEGSPFLQKPFTRADLLMTVKELIGDPLPIEVSALAAGQVRAAETWRELNRPKASGAARPQSAEATPRRTAAGERPA